MRVPRISYARGADGVSLAFTVAGDGPALVFVPWVPFSNLRMEWQNPLLHRVFEQLARELTLVHYDGRGTGHSQQDVTDVSLEAMVSDLEAVIGRTELAQVSLLGQYNSFPFLIQFADIEGKPIHYVDEGSGPALLLVSAGQWSFMFRDMIVRLREQFRCLTFDFPGSGLSPGEPGHDHGLEANARILEGSSTSSICRTSRWWSTMPAGRPVSLPPPCGRNDSGPW